MILETTIYDFKTNLSRYIADIESGKYEKIAVHRRDKLVGFFQLPEKQPQKKLPLGAWRDEFHFDKELFDSADADIDAMFYGTPHKENDTK